MLPVNPQSVCGEKICPGINSPPSVLGEAGARLFRAGAFSYPSDLMPQTIFLCQAADFNLSLLLFLWSDTPVIPHSETIARSSTLLLKVHRVGRLPQQQQPTTTATSHGQHHRRCRHSWLRVRNSRVSP